jgi:hypothetical protein
LDGKWKNIGHSGNCLYPVLQLSSVFKGKFLDSLKRALRKQNQLFLFNDRVQQAHQTKWIVHCDRHKSMPLPGVQNRQDDRYKGTATETLPRMGSVKEISNTIIISNFNFALPAHPGEVCPHTSKNDKKAGLKHQLAGANHLKKHKNLLNANERRAVSCPFYLLNPIKIFNKCIAPDPWV